MSKLCHLSHADQILIEMAALTVIFGLTIASFGIGMARPVSTPVAPPAASSSPVPRAASPLAGHACEERAGDVGQLTACLQAALGQEQAALQSTYARLSRLVPEAGQALERSQKTWSDYVRADCELQATPFAAAQVQRAMHLNCEYVRTAARVRALEALAAELAQPSAGSRVPGRESRR
jgi:uncharacterized protein YecT (DUF1311 family)